MKTKGAAGLYSSWFNLDADLLELKLDPFHVGLSSKQKASYTAGLIAGCLAVLILLDPIAAGIIFVTGLWVVWNQNNRITMAEKKIFLTVMDMALLFAFLERFSVLFRASGLLVAIVILHLVYVWRKK